MATTEGIEIPCVINTDKFDKQINQLNKKIDNEEKKRIQIEADIGNLEQQQKQYDELKAKADEYKAKIEEIQNKINSSKSSTLDPALEGQMRTAVAQYTEAKNEVDALSKNMATLPREQQKLNDKLIESTRNITEYQNQINSLTLQKHQAEIEGVKKKFKEVNHSLANSIKSVGRLALGVIGIGAAFSMIRSASSQLASYDEQYAANLEYIRFALTQAIAPVLRYIVNLAMTLLKYINAILNALFGINIFSNASADDFNKMKKGAKGVGGALSGASKAAKELKKQLAGFDEANILQDQSSADSGTGGVGGGGAMPPFDLSKLQGETPEWLRWIADNKEMVLGFLARTFNIYRIN